MKPGDEHRLASARAFVAANMADMPLRVLTSLYLTPKRQAAVRMYR